MRAWLSSNRLPPTSAALDAFEAAARAVAATRATAECMKLAGLGGLASRTFDRAELGIAFTLSGFTRQIESGLSV